MRTSTEPPQTDAEHVSSQVGDGSVAAESPDPKQGGRGNFGGGQGKSPAANLGDNRKLAIALAVVLTLVFAFVASYLATSHAPQPHGLPIGVVGSPQAASSVEAQLNRSSEGQFKVTAYSSDAQARTAILNRQIYGAFEPGPPPSLLVASAASSTAASTLEKTFQAETGAQGQSLAIHDVAPLPSSDSVGATASSLILSLILAGTFGSTAIYTVVRYRNVGVRLAAAFMLGISAGLLAALATLLIGAFSGHFVAVWLVATLFVLAVVVPIAGFQSLLGPLGALVGIVLFVVIADPAAGGNLAPQYLPGLWRAINPLLPQGAGVSAMRNGVYFHWHGAAWDLVTLGVYVVLGAALAIAASWSRGKGSRATIVGQQPPRGSVTTA